MLWVTFGRESNADAGQLILEQFGVTVDYNVEIDFEAFVTIIGHLDGWAALNYARMRHATPADSDINRAGRQRAVIGSILEKCRSMTAPQGDVFLIK